MKLLKERDQVRTVAARWRSQYGAGSYHFDTRKRMAGGELAALDAETATAVEVAEIVGHGSWVKKNTCDECGAETWDAVEVGQPPDYESSTATICENCLSAALRLLGADCSVQALDDAQPVQPSPVSLIKECRDALAEELAAWDLEPPLHHVKQAHDRCVKWLLTAGEMFYCGACERDVDGPCNSGDCLTPEVIAQPVQPDDEALRKDAERYRWLRERIPGGDWRIEGVIYGGVLSVDAQIDAAMKPATEPT